MLFGVGIGDRSHAKRTGMRGHVEAVREKRHRVKQNPSNDLDHHHSSGQQHDPERAPCVPIMEIAQKDVIVGELFQLCIK